MQPRGGYKCNLEGGYKCGARRTQRRAFFAFAEPQPILENDWFSSTFIIFSSIFFVVSEIIAIFAVSFGEMDDDIEESD